ncbi:MAG: SDR family NAD(P)-dependent oxidoreductase [Propionibacteriaceae bacterium]|nr:SDR family NAD(P)-dependent oxidoreductase [Propionibacteriaceae bacterium]
MNRKTIVITGASDGIGAAAARQLAADGHRLVLIGRSPDKLARVADELGAESIVADFADLAQVRHMAEEVLRLCPTIDVLANNAGLINGSERVATKDGHEATNQINYLATFLINHLLAERLVAGRSTVIMTSSMAHWGGRIDLDDLDHERSYVSFAAYADSKLALLLHTRQLQRNLGRRGVAAVAFHPGVVGSNFSVDAGGFMGSIYSSPAKALLTSSAKGADSLVFLAEATPGVDFRPGGYVIKRRPAATRACVNDVKLGEALWAATERTLGL